MPEPKVQAFCARHPTEQPTVLAEPKNDEQKTLTAAALMSGGTFALIFGHGPILGVIEPSAAALAAVRTAPASIIGGIALPIGAAIAINELMGGSVSLRDAIAAYKANQRAALYQSVCTEPSFKLSGE